MIFSSGGYARKNGFQFELKYSSWLVWAVWEYCSIKNDPEFAVQ